MRSFCKLCSFCGAFLFVICTGISLYLAITGDYGTSIGFGLLACINFIGMVSFGYLGLR